LGSAKRIFSVGMRIGRSRSSKVIDFGTNRRYVCDVLLDRHRNLGPILHHFRDIAGFCAYDPPLLHPNLGVGVSIGSDRPCWGQPEQNP